MNPFSGLISTACRSQVDEQLKPILYGKRHYFEPLQLQGLMLTPRLTEHTEPNCKRRRSTWAPAVVGAHVDLRLLLTPLSIHVPWMYKVIWVNKDFRNSVCVPWQERVYHGLLKMKGLDEGFVSPSFRAAHNACFFCVKIFSLVFHLNYLHRLLIFVRIRRRQSFIDVHTWPKTNETDTQKMGMSMRYTYVQALGREA